MYVLLEGRKMEEVEIRWWTDCLVGLVKRMRESERRKGKVRGRKGSKESR